MKKICFLFDGNFEIRGKVSAYRAGDIIEVSNDDAQRLVEGLCAELLNEKPAEKPRKKEAKWLEEQ